MKKQFYIMFAVIMITAFTTQAARIRVNNQGLGAPHTTINAAINAAASGDTIYVEGSPVNYSGFSCSKRVVIIGPGYFLGNNPQTQANQFNATVGGSSFYEGSTGSIVMGIKFSSGNYYTCIDIHDTCITIKRNCFYLSSTHSDNQPAIRIYASKTIIVQNYIERAGNGWAIYTPNSGTIGLIISNNYIAHTSGGTALNNLSNGSATVTHNVFSGNVYLYNANVFNNIIKNGNFSSTNSIVSNNIGNGTQFPLPDNMQNVDMNLVFNLSDPSPDGKYRLIDDVSNPAIGYGALGEDCGMFGGNNPYKLSGIPPVPAIYYFYAPATGSGNSNLPSDIKIKSNN
ncbi:MAG: hypothetical protein PHR81_02785 [Bacteroidales bacterium]|jgi:hypothetical protein|nr:hypothetical protein [Bacteroidales bacterium]MDD4213715.1 hypothetical protein [Bacteroidales bacterium]